MIEEIIKGLQAIIVTNWTAHYYRSRSGVEVDLVLTGPFGVLPIEIKHGVSTPIKSLNSLQRYIVQHDLPSGLVINQTTVPMWLSDKIFQLPVGCL